jgi:hypothetical protein
VPRIDRPKFFRTLVALLLVQPIYAANKFPDYPVHPAGDYAVTAEKAGVTIGVQPVDDLNDQKTYFNMELTPKGFIPVFIVIQNGSSGDSFLFDKTGAKFGQVVLSGSAPKTSMKAGKVAAIDSVAIASSVAVPLVGAIFAIAAFNNADRVRHNIVEKEVQSRTLSPGASLCGFLYVPTPKKGPRQKIRLEIPITRAGTNDTYVLDVIF